MAAVQRIRTNRPNLISLEPQPAPELAPGEEEIVTVTEEKHLHDWSKQKAYQQRRKMPRVLTCADFTTLSWVEDMRNFPQLYRCEADLLAPDWLTESDSGSRYQLFCGLQNSDIMVSTEMWMLECQYSAVTVTAKLVK